MFKVGQTVLIIGDIGGNPGIIGKELKIYSLKFPFDSTCLAVTGDNHLEVYRVHRDDIKILREPE